MALTQVQGGMILASGQSIPKAALPTGSVLQVINATLSTMTTTTSSSFVDSGLSASITPTASTSKILVLVSQVVYTNSGSPTAGATQLVRGSTSILVEGWSFYSGDQFYRSNFNYLDSPATTSSTTYKTQFRKYTSGSPSVGYAYGDGTGQTNCSITLMEIAA